MDADCGKGLVCDGTCYIPTCSDNRKNGDEVGIDCGGNCAPAHRCPDQNPCKVAQDCQSFVCSSGTCIADIVVPKESMIDDMESLDGYIPNSATGTAASYISSDGSGVLQAPSVTVNFPPTVIPGGRGVSQHAWHLQGKGFTKWGIVFGIDFVRLGAGKTVFDASKYRGITFWARSDKKSPIALAVAEARTDPEIACPANCFDNFRIGVILTEEWIRYQLHFDALRQSGFGAALGALDTTQLVGLSVAMEANVDFDVWVDDIAFLL